MTTPTTDALATFYRARLNDDTTIGAAADQVDPGPWTAEVNEEARPDGAGIVLAATGHTLWDCEGADSLCMTGPSAQHAARHNPTRVLADIAAKRALLDDLLAEHHRVVDGDCWYTCPAATEQREGDTNCDDDRRGGPCDCGLDERTERRLRILAQPYAAHPDYQETWCP